MPDHDGIHGFWFKKIQIHSGQIGSATEQMSKRGKYIYSNPERYKGEKKKKKKKKKKRERNHTQELSTNDVFTYDMENTDCTNLLLFVCCRLFPEQEVGWI